MHFGGWFGVVSGLDSLNLFDVCYGLDMEVRKGQLISKCLLGVFNSFGKRTKKKIDLRYIGVKSKFFVRFLGELKIPNRHFEIT